MIISCSALAGEFDVIAILLQPGRGNVRTYFEISHSKQFKSSGQPHKILRAGSQEHMMSKILSFSICLAFFGMFASDASAQRQPRTSPMVGQDGATTTTQRRFQRGRSPDGRRETFNADGSPRGIHRTCSSAGMQISCAKDGYKQA